MKHVVLLLAKSMFHLNLLVCLLIHTGIHLHKYLDAGSSCGSGIYNTMKRILLPFLLMALLSACSNNKNLAQSAMPTLDTLIQHINSSKTDAEDANPQLAQLQKENDIVISFATLNFAWSRTGTYFVIAGKNGIWKRYQYKAKLSPGNEATIELVPQSVLADSVLPLLERYTKAGLWQTAGDDGGNFCPGNKQCNINDAETWSLSVATPQHIHTTTYYAPQFFEECCPGNHLRSEFVSIGKLMQQLAGGGNANPDR